MRGGLHSGDSAAAKQDGDLAPGRGDRLGLPSEMTESLVEPFPFDEGFLCRRPLRSRSSRLRLGSRLLRWTSALQLRNLLIDLGHPILELFQLILDVDPLLLQVGQ